jgi:hypothetical protein
LIVDLLFLTENRTKGDFFMQNKLNHLLFLFCFIYSLQVKADREQKLAVGQGIAAPIQMTAVNFANGFTYSNAAVASLKAQPVLTLEGDSGEDSAGNNQTGIGGEFSVGTGNAGIALGYYDQNCDGCDGRVGGIAGLSFSSFALGVGYREEDQYSLGLLINSKGAHRFGLVLDWQAGDVPDSDIQSYGVGYSYQGSGFVLALDASKRTTESTADNDDLIRITPGLEIHAQKWALSVSYDGAINDDSDTFDDDVWFGVGYRGSGFQLSFYHDYVNEWSVALSFLF